jgi:hypothetical protein
MSRPLELRLPAVPRVGDTIRLGDPLRLRFVREILWDLTDPVNPWVWVSLGNERPRG